jgi:hypothetical protein
VSLVQDLAEESGRDVAEIAAGAAWLARRDKPLLAADEDEPLPVANEEGMVRLYLNAGRLRGVRPSDIVGAIANEAGIPGRVIGAIDIYDDYSLVDVPAEYSQQVLGAMAGVRMRNEPVSMRVAGPEMQERDRGDSGARRPARRPGARPTAAYGRTNRTAASRSKTPERRRAPGTPARKPRRD